MLIFVNKIYERPLNDEKLRYKIQIKLHSSYMPVILLLELAGHLILLSLLQDAEVNDNLD